MRNKEIHMAAVKEWMMRLEEVENESLAVVMNRLHSSGALWAPRLCASNPEIIMEASESFYPDPAYV
jgi:hypothetical protein